MSVNIIYDNVDVFSNNNLATPSVKRETEKIIMGEQHGIKEIVELSGTIHVEGQVHECDYFNILKDKRDNVVNHFSKNFKKLQIKEGSSIIFERDFCSIESVDFESQPYIKTLEYTIKIVCYDELLHNSFFGIDSPEDNISITRGKDDIYYIDRQLSATGVNIQDGSLDQENTNSGSSALQNAILFVQGRSSKDQIFLPEGENSLNLFLISETESTDRLQNTFAITQQYIADKQNPSESRAIITKKFNRNQTFGTVHSIRIDGEITGDINGSIDNCRNLLKDQNFFEDIKSNFDPTNSLKFNRIPKNQNISEDEKSNKIIFGLDFDNDTSFNECGVSTQMNFEISTKDDSITEVSLSGLITALGPIRKRWDLVKNEFFNKNYDNQNYDSWMHEAAQTELNQFFTSVVLEGEPKDKNITENKTNGTIQFAFNFSDEEVVDDFKNLTLNSSVTMRTPSYSIDMNYGGAMDKYIVSRSGFNKGTITIDSSGEYLNATGVEDTDRANAFSKIEEKVNNLFASIKTAYFSSESEVVTQKNNTYSTNKKIVSWAETREYYDGTV